jgi:hypothetical protein
LRPKRVVSHPVIGMTMPFATRYDVSTHVISSKLAENDPCMCGSDTFTMLVSSTSRIVPSITEAAMSHFPAGAGI